jgi:hypothetical protein
LRFRYFHQESVIYGHGLNLCTWVTCKHVGCSILQHSWHVWVSVLIFRYSRQRRLLQVVLVPVVDIDEGNLLCRIFYV